MSNIRTLLNNRMFLVGATALLSAATGSVGGYYFAKRKLTAEYEEIMQGEIATIRRYYSKVHKRDEFATPEAAAEALGVTDGDVAEAIIDVEKYSSTSTVKEEVDVDGDGEPDIRVTETVEVEVEEPVRRNIFSEHRTEYEFDYEAEERNRTDDAPYVISHDEFLGCERDYQQATLTYFADGGILIDEREEIIPDIDMTIGEYNLERFGHGSKDSKIVYIRNPVISMEFEVIRSSGSYEREVLGAEDVDGPSIRHSSDRRHGVRKFRGDDE